MRVVLRIHWLGWLFLAALLLTSCDSQGTSFGGPVHFEGEPSWAYSLAGPVGSSSVLLALVTNKYGLLEAYACDGQKVLEWFQGPLQGTTLDVTNSDGARLQATLTAQNAQGTLTLTSGPPLTFQINPATKPAGLYRAKQEVNSIVYLAGWILLADGRQAGMLQTAAGQMPAPRLDPAHPEISLPDGGTLTPQLVTPESDL
ncbi:MAG TPA: hypothetical protein VH590_10890 [Ktedonobacterales bacterium]|jgi:hypothetical protein